MKILGIETSCDETAAAVVEDGSRIASDVVASQVDIHARYGGVVPEVASRQHLLTIIPVINQAMIGISWQDINGIAVTFGPGLAGSLLVGVNVAKAIALARNLPITGVNHLEAHIYANWLDSTPYVGEKTVKFPCLCLIVSGGHSDLVLMRGHGQFEKLGRTRDDAAGEAFDKVASMLGLGYPGGPEVERLASQGNERFDFPRPMLGKGFDFSFSGLKTAVLYAVRACSDIGAERADLAASFQAAVFDVLASKALAAVAHTGYPTVVLGGGVACSRSLAKTMGERLAGTARVAVARPRLNADNAAMIARAGWYHLEQGHSNDLYLEASARMPWPGLEPLGSSSSSVELTS